MTGKSVTIADKVFPTKSKAEAFCIESLARGYNNFTCLDFGFWMSLLTNSLNPRHSLISERAIAGYVKEFRSERRDGGIGCVAIEFDGTRHPFSWRSALTPESPDKSLKRFFRQVISPDIQEWRQSRYRPTDEIRCKITNQIVKAKQCHVDHISPSFDEIAQEFISIYLPGLEINLVKFSATGKPGVRTANPPHDWIAEEFRRFHAHKTKIFTTESVRHLRLISSTENLKRGKFNAS